MKVSEDGGGMSPKTSVSSAGPDCSGTDEYHGANHRRCSASTVPTVTDSSSSSMSSKAAIEQCRRIARGVVSPSTLSEP